MNSSPKVNTLNSMDDSDQFYKKLLSIVPHLHPYIKHRIYVAESIGILPQNMYCSNGIIDDAIVQLYHSKFDFSTDTLSLELRLFKIADKHIDSLYQNENWHQKNISTSYFLTRELKKLEENYTVKEGNICVLNTDLDDISYSQEDKNISNFIYDDMDSEILKIIKSEPSSDLKKRKLLGAFYSWLTMEQSKIVDLFIFGKLNFREIALIREISVKEVKRTLICVRKNFRSNLI